MQLQLIYPLPENHYTPTLPTLPTHMRTQSTIYPKESDNSTTQKRARKTRENINTGKDNTTPGLATPEKLQHNYRVRENRRRTNKYILGPKVQMGIAYGGKAPPSKDGASRAHLRLNAKSGTI